MLISCVTVLAVDCAAGGKVVDFPHDGIVYIVVVSAHGNCTLLFDRKC
jgi:hypothetical protein